VVGEVARVNHYSNCHDCHFMEDSHLGGNYTACQEAAYSGCCCGELGRWLLKSIAPPCFCRWAGYGLIISSPVLVAIFSGRDRLGDLPHDGVFCLEVRQSSDLMASQPVSEDVESFCYKYVDLR
jgi:hypothetical protein